MIPVPVGIKYALRLTILIGVAQLFIVSTAHADNLDIECPNDTTVVNDPGDCGAVVDYEPPIGTGDGTGITTILLEGIGDGGFFPIGTSTEVYAVFDDDGDTLTCSFDVIVEDVEAPVVDCDSTYDVTVSSAPGECETQVNYSLPPGSDNCAVDNIQLVSGIPSGGDFPVGVTFVDHTYEDAAGNQAFCRIIVTVLDSSGFELMCPDDISLDVSTQCDTIVDYDPPLNDNLCPDYNVFPIEALGPGASFPLGTTTEIYGASVPGGDTLTCSFDVTITESIAPIFDCPIDTVIQADPGDCEAVFTYTLPTATDNCDPDPDIIQTAGPSSGSAFPTGTTTLEFEATDELGNVSTCSYTVSVEEMTDPQIDCPGDISVDNDTGECGAVVNYTAPEGTDNCPNPTTTLIAGLGSGSLFPVGTTTETYVVTDASGNTDTCSFDISVTDVEPPTLSASDITEPTDPGVCEAVVNYPLPTADDNCAVASLNLISGPASGDLFPIGTTTVTYEALDDAGNSEQVSFDVTVVDEEDPTVNCLADIDLQITSGACDTVFTYTPPTFSDNCPGASISQTAGIGPGGTFPVGTTTETYTVTDAAGNESTCSFNINVSETIDPVITCPPDTTLFLDPDSCEKTVFYDIPEVTDNCDDLSPVLVSGPAPGELFSGGETTVTYEAQDNSGNLVSCSFLVTVQDTTPPTSADCGTPISLDADPDSCELTVNFNPPSATDACGGTIDVTQVGGPSPGDLLAIGNYTLEYTLTDTAGNSTTCTRTLTVNDTGEPEIECPVTELEIELFTVCDSVIDYEVPSFIDDCSPVDSTFSGIGSGGTFPLGETVDTYQYTDTFGNTATCEVSITLFETVPPVPTCPGDISADNDAGSCSAVVDYEEPTGSDNCSGDVTVNLIEGLAPGSSFDVGTTTVSYEIIDESGNADTCSFDVTVNDVEAPVFDCPDTLFFYTDNSDCGAQVEYDAPEASDNCTDDPTVTFISGTGNGTFLEVGNSTEEFEAEDDAGNTTICSFVVAVQDTTPPDFTFCPDDISATPLGNDCEAVVDFTEPTAVDGCDLTITQTGGLSSGSSFPLGSTEIVFEAEDEYGNISVCSFFVEVDDGEAPTFTFCPQDTTTCSTNVVYEIPTAEDNCSAPEVTLIEGPESGSVFPLGETLVQYEATDASGNTDTCSFTVTVLEGPSRADAGGDIALCNSGTVALNANNPDIGSGTWTLISGSGTIEDPDTANTTVSELGEGDNTFVWTVSTMNSCEDNTDTLTISVEFGIEFEIGPDNELLDLGQSIQLDATASEEGDIVWNPEEGLSCVTCEDPVATPTENTTYYATYTPESGCTLTDSLRIRVLGYIPTGFTPDGDGTNDVWNIPGIDLYPDAVVKIFNRWGQLIYESEGYEEPWDGTYEGEDLPAASYFFTIDYQVENKEKESGTVTLIR